MTTDDNPAPERSRIRDLRVTKIERVNIEGFAELTIEAACLDPSPNLDLLKAKLEAMEEMGELLRELFPHFDPLPDDIDPGLGLLLTKMLFLVKGIDAAKGG